MDPITTHPEPPVVQLPSLDQYARIVAQGTRAMCGSAYRTPSFDEALLVACFATKHADLPLQPGRFAGREIELAHAIVRQGAVGKQVAA